ncbi:MAG: carotenoid 1,2-hydratase [Gammaproteobacteria bacterium]|nr:carotenoid 1,2-hydratase [Gammaproteobacteria bacterium]NIR83645.1 carotenoid 1,2-hydratase [Gammaproteobacteria bacterium]NIR91618.1 carotenoid 1,2-hydratase [Gammaproteobacteria bacterium]NIU04807.1 carotenoid 1,2-hydratase [Gammaproteobacteria bacterium]NIV53157.1 carotenoid 1,2-hydratase [Gammaproteobacteria bacterium]
MKKGFWLSVVAAALLVGAAAWSILGDEERPALQAGMRVADLLEEDGSGFARAAEPRDFVFPRDHGPHPDYRTEWWYVTGNLAAPGGREFGFQLTFFRFGLAPGRATRASRWATHQVYMAHFALTDVAAGRFHSAERFSRGALELAGARAHPFGVWLEDWRMAGTGQSAFPLHLRAQEDAFAIDLTLQAGKPRVLHGEEGLSRKSDEPGNASYYYSRTRMPVTGRVRSGEAYHEVEGLAWLDREWSTSALGPDQSGWDWFALQLDDGRELMYYQLRRRDGSPHHRSAGTLVAPDGEPRSLSREDVRLDVLAHWQSPVNGTRYPARWRLRVPGARIALEIVPKLSDQEMNHSVRYWEGAVRVRRLDETAGAGAPAGDGYVELTGYGGASESPSAR